MFALSLGVARISEKLPNIAYALLSGLNAATVGIIALAAVQLSEKAITDKVSRALVFLGATAGMLYNALWYFPVLIAVAGFVTLVWDSGLLHRFGKRVRRRLSRREETEDVDVTEMREEMTRQTETETEGNDRLRESDTDEERIVPVERELTVSWKLGAIVIAGFFITFTAVMVARGVVSSESRPLLFGLFSNMYLAGTIIFGGGPVVIPLLRE